MKALKSLFTLFLLFSFLSSTLGIQVYKHYCGDFLAEISVYIQSNPCADEGGEDACSKGKEMSCCDDETEFYQLDVDLIKQSQEQQKLEFTALQHVQIFESSEDLMEQEWDLNYLSRPPPLSKVPIYKKLQRYTYYG